jgi:hypothetical protein
LLSLQRAFIVIFGVFLGAQLADMRSLPLENVICGSQLQTSKRSSLLYQHLTIIDIALSHDV